MKKFIVVVLLTVFSSLANAGWDELSRATFGILPNKSQVMAIQTIPVEIATVVGCKYAGQVEFEADVKVGGDRDRGRDPKWYDNDVKAKSARIGPSKGECKSLARKYRKRR